MALVKKCRHTRAGARPEGCGCSWYADLRQAGRRRYVRLGPETAAARREYARLRRELEREGAQAALTATDRAGRRFGQVAADWWSIKAPTLAPNTRSGYLSALRRVCEYLDPADVGAIDGLEIARMEARHLEAGFAPSYVRHLRMLARAVLGHARAGGLIAELPEPVAFTLPARTNANDPPVVRPGEMERVLGVLREPYHSLSELTYLTGLRSGEALGLLADALADGQLIIRRNRIQHTGEIAPLTKSRDLRVVDLSPRAREAIARAPGPDRAGRLWPVAYTAWRDHFADALALAGLDHLAPGQRGLHLLRHSNAALRLVSGQVPAYVARQLGHASAAYTLRVYGRWMPSHRDDPALIDAAASRLAADEAARNAAPEPLGRASAQAQSAPPTSARRAAGREARRRPAAP